MPFELPKLSYSYTALEPVIDTKTMELHHSKHHATYTANLNTALENHQTIQQWGIEKILREINSIPEEIRTSVLNNGGGYYNHNIYWEIMTPGGEKAPTGKLATEIERTFESLQNMKSLLAKAALSRFGSGWAWLVVNSDSKLEIYSTPNQNSPLSENKIPLIALDVWEHAYYLNYQNRRAEYVENWMELINWTIVSEKYNKL